MNSDLVFTLIPAQDEPVPADLAQQEERLRHLPLRSPRGLRMPVPGGMYGTRIGAGPMAGPDLASLISLAGKVVPSVGMLVIAFLKVRSGRKVQVKIGETEVVASKVEDVERLLDKIEAIRKGDQS